MKAVGKISLLLLLLIKFTGMAGLPGLYCRRERARRHQSLLRHSLPHCRCGFASAGEEGCELRHRERLPADKRKEEGPVEVEGLVGKEHLDTPAQVGPSWFSSSRWCTLTG
jgi:hypothetical protein